MKKKKYPKVFIPIWVCCLSIIIIYGGFMNFGDKTRIATIFSFYTAVMLIFPLIIKSVFTQLILLRYTRKASLIYTIITYALINFVTLLIHFIAYKTNFLRSGLVNDNYLINEGILGYITLYLIWMFVIGFIMLFSVSDFKNSIRNTIRTITFIGTIVFINNYLNQITGVLQIIVIGLLLLFGIYIYLCLWKKTINRSYPIHYDNSGVLYSSR